METILVLPFIFLNLWICYSRGSEFLYLNPDSVGVGLVVSSILAFPAILSIGA